MGVVDELKRLLPANQVSDQADQLAVASIDESTLQPVKPRAVVWATSTDEVARVVRWCHSNGTPVTTRGGGSALEGSAIPLSKGIVLDLSRMTDILNLWPEDLQVEVQPGIIYDHLNERLKREGLFFPPSPGGSGDIATIGGMVSTNASGIYSVKYGGTRDYVLALEVVTGEGQVLQLGSRAVKRSSGYNLVDLVAGSEGTLAVVTRITLKLEGLPEGRQRFAWSFKSDVDAARAVSEIRRFGLDVAAIEFLDKRLTVALNKLKGYGLKEAPLLFLEFHGSEAAMSSNAELAAGVCEELGAGEITLPDGQNPWEIRHWATDSVKHYRPGYSILRNDIAFPISRLPHMLERCYELGDKNGLMIFAFGHVGMGLLHVLLLARKDVGEEWQLAQEVSNQIIVECINQGGTISGEHGIGLGHKDLFELEHGRSVEMMRKIKRQFDPRGILNPGKIFDLE